MKLDLPVGHQITITDRPDPLTIRAVPADKGEATRPDPAPSFVPTHETQVRIMVVNRKTGEVVIKVNDGSAQTYRVGDILTIGVPRFTEA